VKLEQFSSIRRIIELYQIVKQTEIKWWL